MFQCYHYVKHNTTIVRQFQRTFDQFHAVRHTYNKQISCCPLTPTDLQLTLNLWFCEIIFTRIFNYVFNTRNFSKICPWNYCSKTFNSENMNRKETQRKRGHWYHVKVHASVRHWNKKLQNKALNYNMINFNWKFAEYCYCPLGIHNNDFIVITVAVNSK